MSVDRPQRIVIIGGGIVGLSTAYYVLASPHLPPHSTVTLIESSTRGIAQMASKNAGGFISKYWHEKEVLPLAALSWACHVELANQFGGATEWGWRECGAVGLTVGSVGAERSAYRNLPEGRQEVIEGDWLNGSREDMVPSTFPPVTRLHPGH